MLSSTKHLLHLKPTYELIVIRLLVSLGQAISSVGVSLYFIELGLTDSQIGLFTAAVMLTAAVAFLFLPPVLEKFNQLRLLVGSTLLTGVAFVLFGITDYLVLAMLLFLTIQLATGITDNSKSILFKDSTRSKEEFIRDIGLSGSIGNLGWFIGPLLGGLMLSYAGFSGLFAMAGLFIGLGALYAYMFPFKTAVKKRQKLDTSLKDNLSFYLAKPMLKIAYLQKMGISVWWGFVFAFIPIFMLKADYSVASIGFFIGLTQLPPFLFEFKTVGTVAKIGYRKIFSLAYSSLAIVCIVSFLAPNLGVALAAIIIGCIALSFLEPISELFFYEQVVLNEEEKAYPIFGTATSVGSILIRSSVGLSLVLFADRGAFIVVAFLMLLISYKALGIKPRKALLNNT